VRRDDHRIDMAEVARLAEQHRPKVIVAGGSAYPRHHRLPALREIADSVGAKLMVDMAHFAALVPAAAHPSPFPHCPHVGDLDHATRRCAARARLHPDQRRGDAQEDQLGGVPRMQAAR
jgi:glycine hydroxymethyltransferase